MAKFGYKSFALVSAASVALMVGACTQGEEIESPGATSAGSGPTSPPTSPPPPGTPPAAQCAPGFAEGAPVGGFTTCNISGTVLSNLTLPFVPGTAYRLDGRVDIGIDTGADDTAAGGTPVNLTIEPGVTVFGESGADYLVINRGSQLIADGDPNAPIIMTSSADLERRALDPDDLGGTANQEWGGLVILGQAPINNCRDASVPGTVDCVNIVEGVTNPEAIYGGADPFDSSGILSYLQVRFAGFPINTQGNELNGITFAGVGVNTQVDHIQVHNNSDDGVEFFGGNVNVRYLVLTGNDDDSIDTDNGYQGNIQYAVVLQNPALGDNMVEASGEGVEPRSDATVANFTFVGGQSGDQGNAFRLNTGTIGTYLNGVVMTGQECFRYEGSAGDGVSGFTPGEDPAFQSVLFDCALGLFTGNSDGPTAQGALDADPNNVFGMSSLAATLFPGPNELAITPTDATALDSFFEDAPYAGAFGPTETPTDNWATGWTFALFEDPACPSGTFDSGSEIDGTKICNISGTVTGSVRLVRGNLYQLEGRIDVGVDVGADGAAPGGQPGILTIESGVTVFGNDGGDYIVVNRGSQIFSMGTRENPVIMTSEQDLRGTQPNPDTANQEWGGLVILGRAPTNNCRDASTPGSAQCENIVEGVTNPEAIYGGGVVDDNSGVLRYTRVQFAGFPINTQGNELNGITFAGVGTGTNVEFIQVHNNSDDGVEFFGGGVNVRYLVLTGNDDDSIDTDNGYNGNIQFAIVVQNPALGDNMVEASGEGVDPRSNATVSNFTFFGGQSADQGNAFRLNTGTIGTYVNGVVVTQQECFRYQDSAGDGVPGFTLGQDPAFQSVLFDCALGLFTDNSDAATAQGAFDADPNNILGAGINTLTNQFINGSAEAGVTVVDVTTLDPFFLPVDYVGAVRDADDRWWAEWSCGLEAATPC